MLKRIVLIVLSFVMCIGVLQADASAVVSNSIAELSLKAQHYYNTKVAYDDMYITKINEKTYEIYHYTQSGKSLKIQLYQTDWGTWNLGNMNINDGFVEKAVIGGGTDWEYVFRVLNPINQNLDFTGGNHGSEVLNSIAMRDDVTGEAFTLNVGESKYINRLVIEENTTILLANMDYLPYANVKRVYTIVGKTVNLDCEITFLRDVKMALSYTAMASINKDFSRYCSFDDLAYVTTEPTGVFSNQHLGNVPAAVCYLSGDDPTVSLTVGIYNLQDMTDNFSNRDKTFLWDMSEGFNKLYFSKYSMTGLHTVTAGTVWNLGSFWTVNFE